MPIVTMHAVGAPLMQPLFTPDLSLTPRASTASRLASPWRVAWADHVASLSRASAVLPIDGPHRPRCRAAVAQVAPPALQVISPGGGMTPHSAHGLTSGIKGFGLPVAGGL